MKANKRRLLMALPIITLPFITIVFYTLGGGKMEASNAETATKKGFNFQLPDPRLKEDSSLDKMSYYEQAAADSIKFLEQMKKDPNYLSEEMPEETFEDFMASDSENQSIPKNRAPLSGSLLQDRNEKKVYQKLKALQKAISQPAADTYGQDMREFENYGSSESGSDQIRNLEKIMSSMGESQQPDPELEQLGGMLENILDIQHPQRVQERLKHSAAAKKGKTYKVDLKKAPDNSTSLEQIPVFNDGARSNSFYSLPASPETDLQQNAIQAFVHETQTIVNGSVVKLRIGCDIVLQGVEIAKNSFLYGIAALKDERLEIKIENIQYEGSIFPIQLSVYDLDGIQGIYIPGAISRDVAKASAERSVQSLGLSGISDSWGAQAAGMGIEAAKSLMSKKVKLIKVSVKAGYQVLLYDEKQKNPNQETK